MPTVTGLTKAQFDRQELEKRGILTKSRTTDSLAKDFEEAINEHKSLPFNQRVANSKNAAERVGKFIGTLENGQTKPLLGGNAKLDKAGKNIVMPDGTGVETTGLALSPAFKEGDFRGCPNSPSCKKVCLGKQSGKYRQLGPEGAPQQNTHKRTEAFMTDPKAVAVRLHDEIAAKKALANNDGNKLGVRLNVLSDINPKIHKPLIDAHRDVDFYDYTKNAYQDPVAPNHHLTYSSTGVSQPKGENGLSEDVYNPHQNWDWMEHRLGQGHNISMSFSHKSALPKEVHSKSSGKIYKVLDGTLHDYRPMDGRDENGQGFIIGLKNMDEETSQHSATAHSKGFFVHYDPQFLTDKKGKLIRDMNAEPTIQKTGANKGKKVYPPIATNHIVTIHPQKPSRPLMDNDGRIHTLKDYKK
jgi:hypothetical protein